MARERKRKRRRSKGDTPEPTGLGPEPVTDLSAFGLDTPVTIEEPSGLEGIDDEPPGSTPAAIKARTRAVQDGQGYDVTPEAIVQSTQASGGGDRWLSWQGKKNGDKYEVRFLDDLRSGVKVPRHAAYPGLRPTTCPKRYDPNAKCRYCDEGVPQRDWYAWNVIDFSTGKVKVAAFKAVAGGVPQQLATFFAEYETILNTNYVITQLNEGKDRTFQVLPKPRTDPETRAKIKRAIEALLPKRHNLLEVFRPPAILPAVGQTTTTKETPTAGDEFELNI